MAYHRFYRQSKPTVRTITVKYAGKCMCCGGAIPAGAIADYYPIGTIAGVHNQEFGTAFQKITVRKIADSDYTAGHGYTPTWLRPITQ